MANLYTLVRIFCIVLCCLLSHSQLKATHNRSGEIVVERINCGDPSSELTVKITILTYTKTSSVDADRDSLTLDFGDGTQQVVARINGVGNPPQGEPLENDVKKNIYCAIHTYPAYGNYQITMFDRNRNGNIININNSNSVNIPFFLQTSYQLVNSSLQGCNSTPTLEQPPLDFGCVGEVFTHNPLAIDPDGDSLSFHFTVPLQMLNDEVPGYQFPDQIGSSGNNLSIDVLTGDIIWDAPALAGEYNLAIYIVEYRNGVPLDTVLRDMQILVFDCENEPPTVEIEQDEYCVVAGEVVEFDVIAGAPVTDIDQQVRLTANGAPLNLEINPATFTPATTDFEEDPLVKTFRWQTTCEHIEDQFYTVVFRAVDNFLDDSTGLATLKSVRIRVVGPPPEDVRADLLDNDADILVSWQLPYVCEDAQEDYFRGFTVWRRLNSNQFPYDSCRTGLDGRGYTLISGEIPIIQAEDGRYVFLDETAERGRTYCYRILAEFARRTTNGLFFYNPVSSLPSLEVCIQVGRDIPLLTNVDVQTTSPTDGRIEVCWSKPDPIDLDTVANPGPYVYQVWRAVGQTTASEDFSSIDVEFVSETFAGANDTCFVDTGLNTQDNPYSYLLKFFVREDDLVGESTAATSIFLTTSPTDRANILNWSEDVPWDNIRYVIYRSDPGSMQFDSIDVTPLQTYRDTGLVNGEQYCYYIRSIGSYGVEGIRDPLFNRSQEKCETPFDNVPPCPPELMVESVCDKGIDCRNQEELFNTLTWLNPDDICEETDDVQGYNVYYAAIAGGEFTRVAVIEDGSLLLFDHMPPEGIAGCYAVTAFDENNNESEFSNIICVDNCPFYELPNAFTPNGDNQNDLYVPFDYCFIDRVEFEVFNRWGQLVFTTQDPDLNWDGTNQRGEELSDGTYFYRCRVFESRVDGVRPAIELLSGYIELLRGRP